MPDITELQDKRAREIANAQDVVAEAEEERGEDATLTAEERELFDRHMDRAEELADEINDVKADQRRRDRLQQEAERVEPTIAGREAAEDMAAGGEDREQADGYGEKRDQAFRRYLFSGPNKLSQDELELLSDRQASGGREYRASDLVVGTSNLGGVFVPEDFEDTLFMELKDFSGLREAVDEAPGIFPLMTADGRDLPVPTLADTSQSGSLVSEGSTIGTVTDPTFSNVVMSAAMYQSGPVTLSFELMQDAEIPPEDTVRDLITERLGRITSKHLIDSTGGTDRGEGLVNASSGAVSIANGSSNLTFTDLYDLKYSVDRAHRRRFSGWVFTDQTFRDILKVKDADGQFLYQPDVTRGPVNQLLGDPVFLDNSSTTIEFDAVASASTAKKVIWYGNFGRFGIRDIRPVTLLRLDEKFALSRQVGFVGFMREDHRTIAATTDPAQKPIRCLVENT